MGEEQRNLARSFDGFIAMLEDPAVRANYRIGFTTTDNGNMRCAGTGPESGSLVLSSCRSHIGDFTFGTGPNADHQESADQHCRRSRTRSADGSCDVVSDPKAVSERPRA